MPSEWTEELINKFTSTLDFSESGVTISIPIVYPKDRYERGFLGERHTFESLLLYLIGVSKTGLVDEIEVTYYPLYYGGYESKYPEFEVEFSSSDKFTSIECHNLKPGYILNRKWCEIRIVDKLVGSDLKIAVIYGAIFKPDVLEYLKEEEIKLIHFPEGLTLKNYFKILVSLVFCFDSVFQNLLGTPPISSLIAYYDYKSKDYLCLSISYTKFLQSRGQIMRGRLTTSTRARNVSPTRIPVGKSMFIITVPHYGKICVVNKYEAPLIIWREEYQAKPLPTFVI